MRVTRLARLLALAALAATGMVASTAHAAFMVEARATATVGKGFGGLTFGGDTTAASTSTATTAAVGTTAALGSIFGGTGVLQADTYIFSYTPGTNADNTVYVANQILGSTTGFPGNGNLATGAVGGASGTYNVYFTAPPTTNIDGGPSNFTITQNGPNILLSANLNNVGTGPDTDPGTAFVGGANNAWFKLGTVTLNAGTTYSVSQASTANTFVSQRASAVMWEYVPVPEPTTLTMSLAGMGLIGALAVARRKTA